MELGQAGMSRYSNDIRQQHSLSAMHHPKRLAEESFKSNAFQWAQTILRVCGYDQLQQTHIYAGDDWAEELFA